MDILRWGNVCIHVMWGQLAFWTISILGRFHLVTNVSTWRIFKYPYHNGSPKMRNPQYGYPDDTIKKGKKKRKKERIRIQHWLAPHHWPWVDEALSYPCLEVDSWDSWKATIGPIIDCCSFQLSSSSPPLVRVSPFQSGLGCLCSFDFVFTKKTLSNISKLFGWGHGAFDDTSMDPW